MATARYQVYKCEACGNIVQVLHGGGAVLVCCGKPMVLLSENTVDAAVEKHVPVVQQTGSHVSITVGSTPHPMEENHYIEWIEVTAGDLTRIAFLKPGGAPQATFEAAGGPLTVRAYCNLHGLWKA